MTEDDLLGSAEIGRRLQIDPRSVSRLLRRGRLPGRKVGRTWIVRAADVERLARFYTGRPGRPPKGR